MWPQWKVPVGRSASKPPQTKKILPDAWGDELDKSPLLLERIFHTSIVCLRVSMQHPCHQFYRVGRPFDLISDILFSPAVSPMKPPRWRLPVTMHTPIPRKYASVLGKFCSELTKMLLVSSRKDPCGGPFTSKYVCAPGDLVTSSLNHHYPHTTSAGRDGTGRRDNV